MRTSLLIQSVQDTDVRNISLGVQSSVLYKDVNAALKYRGRQSVYASTPDGTGFHNTGTNTETTCNFLLKVKPKRVGVSPNIMLMPTFNVTIRIRSPSQSVSQPAQGNSGPGIYASDR